MLPTFRDNLSAPCLRPLEHGTDTSYRRNYNYTHRTSPEERSSQIIGMFQAFQFSTLEFYSFITRVYVKTNISTVPSFVLQNTTLRRRHKQCNISITDYRLIKGHILNRSCSETLFDKMLPFFQYELDIPASDQNSVHGFQLANRISKMYLHILK